MQYGVTVQFYHTFITLGKTTQLVFSQSIITDTSSSPPWYKKLSSMRDGSRLIPLDSHPVNDKEMTISGGY